MYNRDAVKIAAAFKADPLGVFPKVVQFVLATIQQQFQSVPDILAQWDAEGWEAETCWGMKKGGMKWLSHYKKWSPVALKLHECVREGDRVGGLDVLISIPGINTVKAAFIGQLCGLQTSCLDTQNCQLHGIKNIRVFHIPSKQTAKTRLAKLEAYLALCDKLGTPETFWNTWCELIAAKYKGTSVFETGDDVSALHASLILGRVKSVPF